MKHIALSIISLLWVINAFPERLTYNFKSQSLSEALTLIAEQHPELKINFIYNELDNYKVNATINTDNVYNALKKLTDLNPVSVIKKDDRYYIEALQHGKYRYFGKVVGNDNEPVVAATVMLLTPKDSVIITYGLTDEEGRFSIPCDKKDVIGKLSHVGYKTMYHPFINFSIGTIKMSEHPIALKSLNVAADRVRLYADKSVYLPSARQKNSATDATDLLRLMAIPQISINPVNGEISNNFGKKISVFINNIEASKEDIEGLRTQEVRKVEYLDFPSDPRFHGAEYVINFIVQEYIYGGYTKISTSDSFVAGFSNQSTVFSKFSFRKWTYDFYVSSDNENNHHTGSSMAASYSLKDDQGLSLSLKRIEDTEHSHYRKDQFPLTFRASYNTDDIQVRNTIGFTHDNVRANNQSGSLTYNPSNGMDYSFSCTNPSIQNSVAYNGLLYLNLSNNLSINLTPKFSYSHNNDMYCYYATGHGSPIERLARENAYYYRVDASLTKQINDKHSISIGANSGDWINKLTYYGTNNYRDSFHLGFVAALLNYKFSNNRINMNARIGVCHEPSRINSISDRVTYPFALVNLGYSPDSKNSFMAHIELSNSSPTINQKVSDILQQNEFMFVTGNPYLKSSPVFGAQLSYSLIPTRNLTLSIFGFFIESFNRSIVTYESYNEGRAILRSLINNGNNTTGSIGMSASLNLLNNSLQLYANPSLSFYKSTGVHKKTVIPLFIALQSTYYLSKFYFKFYYQTPQKGVFTMYPGTFKIPNYHSLSLGWANSRWNLRLTASNFFNRKWINRTEIIYSELYSFSDSIYGTEYHSKINVSATFTFGYGKKVAVGNEVGKQGSASSAILK